MALNCGQITASITGSNCGAGSVALDNYIYIVNRDDIDYSASAEADGVVSALVLKTGKKGYKYTSNNKAFEGTSALNKGTYSTSFDHSIVGRVFANTQAIKDELNKLAFGKFVVVVANNSNANEETKFEVYGWENGLVCTALDKNTADGDGIVYSFTLASDEGAREGDIPKSFYNTDLATTEAALEALL